MKKMTMRPNSIVVLHMQDNASWVNSSVKVTQITDYELVVIPQNRVEVKKGYEGAEQVIIDSSYIYLATDKTADDERELHIMVDDISAWEYAKAKHASNRCIVPNHKPGVTYNFY